jgi:hypothetical protein
LAVAGFSFGLDKNGRISMRNAADEGPRAGQVPLANRTPNHVSRDETGRDIALPLSRVTKIGEQAIAAVAASLARGGPVIKGQVIASRFYEAMQRELKQLPMHDPERAALIAARDRCERIAAAKINPAVLLDELRKAVAVLTDEHPSEPAPIKRRPVLRLIEGGLST